jgi:ATP-dependent Lhr-like helicase
LLPARLDDYDFTWLDDLCFSGRAVWTRLTLPGAATSTMSPGPIRTSPVALLPRRTAPLWNRVAASPTSQPVEVSPRAQRIVDYLSEHGASFYDELVDGTRLLRTQVEEALAELVAFGVVTSDSFAGLRALLTPSEKRKPFGARRAHRRAMFGIEDAGRWALLKRREAPAGSTTGYVEYDQPTLEHIAHTLLRRYGVVFWRVLQREAAWLPPWRELLRVLRRLEARGDIRGGRFVAGISGEQFALKEAVQALRDTRRTAMTGELIAVSGADPLNLVGVLLPGAKVPALTGNRVLYRDGAAVAALVGGDIQWYERLDGGDIAMAEAMLIQRRIGSPLLAYLR